ncbi:NUDIX domain-containing protein [Vagococcus sp. BWB3-3]|uniref:NUDIX domain-containing protein n=1 Tax=Vagococcus allomyrinae TaxID=2794353 RepID=A0A940STT5_9ENTE|nr:NUDIX hydrolase [Vagococcus allomyrinae]MBP1040635.1 NUDIX domain-containing protein [Vagococcus allomyrinae]
MIPNQSGLFTKLTPLTKEFIQTSSTSSLIIASHKHKLIIGYNDWRDQWEFPAGKRDVTDADSYATARREFFEETHLRAENLRLLGFVTIHTFTLETRYRAIFTANLTQFSSFIPQSGDEMSKLALVAPTKLTSLNMAAGDLAIYQQLQKEGLFNV